MASIESRIFRVPHTAQNPNALNRATPTMTSPSDRLTRRVRPVFALMPRTSAKRGSRPAGERTSHRPRAGDNALALELIAEVGVEPLHQLTAGVESRRLGHEVIGGRWHYGPDRGPVAQNGGRARIGRIVAGQDGPQLIGGHDCLQAAASSARSASVATEASISSRDRAVTR